MLDWYCMVVLCSAWPVSSLALFLPCSCPVLAQHEHLQAHLGTSVSGRNRYLGRHRGVWEVLPNYGQAISLCVRWVLGNPGPLGAHPCLARPPRACQSTVCPIPSSSSCSSLAAPGKPGSQSVTQRTQLLGALPVLKNAAWTSPVQSCPILFLSTSHLLPPYTYTFFSFPSKYLPPLLPFSSSPRHPPFIHILPLSLPNPITNPSNPPSPILDNVENRREG